MRRKSNTIKPPCDAIVRPSVTDFAHGAGGPNIRRGTVIPYLHARSIRRSAAPFFALLALTLCVAALPAPARSEAPDASRLISDLGTRALAIVRETTPDSSARFGRFHELVADSFDVPLLARFVTGTYWTAASEDERRRFTSAFGDYVTDLVTTRFARYRQQSFSVVGQRDIADGVALVSIEVADPKGSQPDRVDWQVAKTADGFRIRDVSVSGVSIAETKRSEFASMLARTPGGLAALTATLEKRFGRPAETAKND
jgi:phospholipid transport system substrate-binding protein